MHRVLLSASILLFLAPACSSTSDSSSATTPSGESTPASSETAPEESVGNEKSEGEDTHAAEPDVAGNFTNLQVLPKDISEANLKATMKQVSNSLGVQCDFCHVDENMASDDNPHKLAARGMISMTMDLNKEFFGGEQVVTCMTCHKGKEHPLP